RQRRGQVVAQRDPLLVVVLEREHALIGPVLVGEEFAERVGIFHRRRLHRLKTVELEDLADFLHHRPRRRDLGGAAIGQPARQARLELWRFFGFVGHLSPRLGRRWYQPTREAATSLSCLLPLWEKVARSAG